MEEGNNPGSYRAIVAALILLAALLAASLWLTGALRSNAVIQDCVQSGRTNCAPNPSVIVPAVPPAPARPYTNLAGTRPIKPGVS